MHSGHLNSFADSLGEYLPLADVIGQHLTDSAERRFADCSPTTKNQGMRTVKACWAWGCQQGILKVNALKYAKMPTPKIREVFFRLTNGKRSFPPRKTRGFGIT